MCERRYFAAAIESCDVKKRTITSVAFGGGETNRLRKSSFSPGPRMLRLGKAFHV
jgi:hypothetical protein